MSDGFDHMHMPGVPQRHEMTNIPPWHGVEYVLGELLPENFTLNVERGLEHGGIVLRIHGMIYGQTVLPAQVEMSLALGSVSEQSIPQILALEHKGIALDLARFLEEEAANLREAVTNV